MLPGLKCTPCTSRSAHSTLHTIEEYPVLKIFRIKRIENIVHCGKLHRRRQIQWNQNSLRNPLNPYRGVIHKTKTHKNLVVSSSRVTQAPIPPVNGANSATCVNPAVRQPPHRRPFIVPRKPDHPPRFTRRCRARHSLAHPSQPNTSKQSLAHII